MRRSRELREATEIADAEEMAGRLADKVIASGPRRRRWPAVRLGDLRDIVTALAEQANVVLDRKAIDSEPIKELGTHTVMARVHPEVEFP